MILPKAGSSYPPITSVSDSAKHFPIRRGSSLVGPAALATWTRPSSRDSLLSGFRFRRYVSIDRAAALARTYLDSSNSLHRRRRKLYVRDGAHRAVHGTGKGFSARAKNRRGEFEPDDVVSTLRARFFPDSCQACSVNVQTIQLYSSSALKRVNLQRRREDFAFFKGGISATENRRRSTVLHGHERAFLRASTS